MCLPRGQGWLTNILNWFAATLTLLENVDTRFDSRVFAFTCIDVKSLSTGRPICRLAFILRFSRSVPAMIGAKSAGKAQCEENEESSHYVLN